MSNLDVMYSSKSDEWATPQKFFDEINKEFDFNLDVCATDQNHKCDKYYTSIENGLEKNWGGTEYGAIHHTVRLINGLKKHFMRQEKTTHLCAY